MNPLRSLLLSAAGDERLRKVVSDAPVSRDVVSRFVAGESTEDGVRAAVELAEQGLCSTLDFLGEDVADVADAEATVRSYEELFTRLDKEGVANHAEGSLKLTAVGLRLDEELAYRLASQVCEAAEAVGTTVTLDMEDHTVTDPTLSMVHRLRERWPSVGAVVQTSLRRTEDDCAALAGPASRVRLCKGAYAHPDQLAHHDAHQVDLAYVRCAKILLAGAGVPMFATHDPRLIEILEHLIDTGAHDRDAVEMQLLYGIRPQEQTRLAGAGRRVRVYVPYGGAWYGYLMRRMAERPANTAFFLRSLATRS